MNGARASLAIGCGVLADQILKWGIATSSAKHVNGGLVFFRSNEMGPFSLAISNATVIGISLGVLALIAFGYSRIPSPLIRIGLMFVLTGGISNLVDRLVRGAVIDVFRIGPLYWNIADLLIVVGVAIIIWKSVRAKGHNRIPKPV